MSAQVIKHWLNIHRNSVINPLYLKPSEHKLLKGKPVSSQRDDDATSFTLDEPKMSKPSKNPVCR